MAAPAALDDRADFRALSVELTGFSDVELLGTGVGDLYHDWLAKGFPDVLAALLSAWRAIVRTVPKPQWEDALRKKVLADPKLGPFTRGVIVLWYTATWNQLPKAWRDAYGARAQDQNVCFDEGWPEGLVWKAGGTHPQGAKPTGYGGWARAPAAVDGAR